MKDVIMVIITAAIYAVFLHNLVFSGGLGASEVLRAAQRNSEPLMTSVMVSLFTTALAVICRLLESAWLQNTKLAYAWRAAVYGGVLLALYIVVCVVIASLPLRIKRLLLKRIGMSALNSVVMAVPLLIFRAGENLSWAIGMGLGAGVAFFLVTLLINSGLHILQQNKAIPPVFSGVPAALIYTGLLALAFTGFTAEALF
ncbi:MAG: hypothetical protein LBG83_06095 [Oscillospiraceae bacterium]|jgi:electron transport complex protein RnfA|nr:hypothetical protein [Oscillospiraceae bacterium]